MRLFPILDKKREDETASNVFFPHNQQYIEQNKQ